MMKAVKGTGLLLPPPAIKPPPSSPSPPPPPPPPPPPAPPLLAESQKLNLLVNAKSSSEVLRVDQSPPKDIQGAFGAVLEQLATVSFLLCRRPFVLLDVFRTNPCIFFSSRLTNNSNTNS